MAGDTVKISAEALYIPEKTNAKEVANNVLNSFVTAFATPVGLAAEGIATTADNGMKNLATAILNMQNEKARNGGPKAFLNYILYDEQMNLIQEGSGALQVQEKEGWQTLETDPLRIPENGFLRVFSSNTEEAPVSMNNTMLAVIPGKLVEEYNYYPYGIAFGASSANSSIKKTDYLYNGKEIQHNEFGAGNGLELEDYGARLYDVQVGRWTTPDELGEITESESPFCYVGSNPIQRTDPDGKTWGDIIIGIAAAVVDNVYPGSNRSETAPVANASDFNVGQKIGQAASIIIGAEEVATGGGMMAAGGLGTVLSAGSLSGVSVPVIAGGAIAAGHGVSMISKGAANLMTGNGQRQEKPNNQGTYAPDRSLPRDKNGNPIPDKEASGNPHTQLGTKKGSKGKYTQAREFDQNGKPVKDVDFTDHGRPSEHTNPHEHTYKENKTGGTPSRGTPQPLNKEK
jgi:RHS repeat-associated protein